MRIVVNTIDKSKYEIENITELSFTQTAGVACDCLCVSFKSSAPVGEIITVKAYEGDVLLFSGYCDNQRISQNSSGFEVYFYARSTASVLVDNEAEPFTYVKPTAKQLWFTYARPFGFTCQLPVISTDEKYEVTKGTSCYGAINQFVSLKTSQPVYVTPDNCIRLLEKSKDVKSLNYYNILSAVYVINRSEPLSRICFKRNSGDAGYRINTKANVYEDLELNERKQYVNLSALPQWQREYAVLQKLKRSYDDYKILELTVSGWVKENLYQCFSYRSKAYEFDDFVLTEKRYICDEKGSVTKLTLKKEIDVKEITYVD